MILQGNAIGGNMNRRVIREFRKYPQVTLITRINYQDYIGFNVYTPNLKYDRELLEALISSEIVILDRYPKKILSFDYRTFNPEVHETPRLCKNEKVIYTHDRR